MNLLSVLLILIGSVSANADSTVCDSLKGKTFVSDNNLPVGLGEDGVILDRWEVSFALDGSKISIHEHDYTASGSYSCDNREGKFVLDKGERVGKWTGFFNLRSNVLILEGHWYHESKP